MLIWALDKLIRPEHAAEIYQSYYQLSGFAHIAMYVIGALELILLILFVLGLFKRVTYGLVLIFHAISTVSSFKQYFAPYVGPHLLFFAAWPMLAACFALYLLREKDTLLALH